MSQVTETFAFLQMFVAKKFISNFEMMILKITNIYNIPKRYVCMELGIFVNLCTDKMANLYCIHVIWLSSSSLLQKRIILIFCFLC